MPVAKPNRNLRESGVTNPDRGKSDPSYWEDMHTRYIQPVYDAVDSFKAGYDSLINALSGKKKEEKAVATPDKR